MDRHRVRSGLRCLARDGGPEGPRTLSELPLQRCVGRRRAAAQPADRLPGRPPVLVAVARRRASERGSSILGASGHNVWWVSKPGSNVPALWSPRMSKPRHISRGWGPAADATLRRNQRLDLTIASCVGGQGSVCFDRLTLEAREPDKGWPLVGSAIFAPGSNAAHAVDGDPETAWTGELGVNVAPLVFELRAP